MNDAARARLGKFIQAYGPAVCNTPAMCQIMLNQYCGSYPEESQALNRALSGGAVGRLLATKPGESWDKLAEPLVKELANGGMAEADANWAVESWGRALGKHPEGIQLAPEPTITAMSEPERPNMDEPVVAKAASYTLLVAGSGAAGGALGAMAIMFVGAILASAFVEALVPEKSKHADLILAAVVLVYGVIGGIGGGIGGAAGWILGKGGSSRPWGAVKGCFGGAFLAAAIGGRLGGPIGIFFAPLIASIGAALTGAYNS